MVFVIWTCLWCLTVWHSSSNVVWQKKCQFWSWYQPTILELALDDADWHYLKDLKQLLCCRSNMNCHSRGWGKPHTEVCGFQRRGPHKHVSLLDPMMLAVNHMKNTLPNISLLAGGLEHFYFPYIGDNNPNWQIFFGGVEATNQFSLVLKPA
jgi:hypothetical protein